MKKIQAMRLEQKGKEFFFFIADPRDIISEVEIPNKDAVQDFQRPWKEKRVKSIAKYVAGLDSLNKEAKKRAKGLLPSSAVLNLKANDIIQIEKEGPQYFIQFPTTEEEKEKAKGALEILDGQHRLIAFSPEYRRAEFKDNEHYDMGFILFDKLLQEEKSEIFLAINDRAEKVDKAVLHNMLKWLGLLSQEEDELFQLISKLNQEDQSPLKGRINIKGGRLTNGFKLLRVQSILKKSKMYDDLKNHPIADQVKFISTYLAAWEDSFDIHFNNRSKPQTLEKIGGLEYVCLMYSCIFSILKEQKQKFTKENIKKIVDALKEVAWDSVEKDILKPKFSGESAITSFAEVSKTALMNHLQDNGTSFDPFADIS